MSDEMPPEAYVLDHKNAMPRLSIMKALQSEKGKAILYKI